MLQHFVKVPVSGSKCSAHVEENRPFELLLLVVVEVIYTIQYKNFIQHKTSYNVCSQRNTNQTVTTYMKTFVSFTEEQNCKAQNII